VNVLGHVPRLEPYFARDRVRGAAPVSRRACRTGGSRARERRSGGRDVGRAAGTRAHSQERAPDRETADEIAARVVDVIRHPDRAAWMAERGREWALATFTWRSTLDALEGRADDPAFHDAEPLSSAVIGPPRTSFSPRSRSLRPWR
jgi:hypothetical protein